MCGPAPFYDLPICGVRTFSFLPKICKFMFLQKILVIEMTLLKLFWDRFTFHFFALLLTEIKKFADLQLADWYAKNFSDCRLRIIHNKFADLRFADWHTKKIAGFAIRNEPRNEQFINLRTCFDIISFKKWDIWDSAYGLKRMMFSPHVPTNIHSYRVLYCK